MEKQLLPELLDIEWLQECYRSGALTPQAVVEEIVRRAERDEALNIWITPPSMTWIQPYMDRLPSKPSETSPLWGIPFAIKDNIDLGGVPTTAACPAFAYTPAEDATVVARLIAAGAITVGKTNLDQFATGLVGTRSPYGEAGNALRPELISGGSSSGSAVAVARGQACFSLGTDTAGSGRVPAALHGLIGYKPSLGAWPTKGVVPACESLDCVNVFAVTLADALAVDRVVRGPEASDPWSRELLRVDAALPERVVLPEGELEFYGPYASEYQEAWGRALARLESLGVPVVYVDYARFAEAAKLLYEGPYVAERWAGLGVFVEAHPGTTFPVTEQILRSGAAPQHTAASLFQAMHRLQRYRQETRELLAGAVLAMPTCGGTWTRDQVREQPIATNSAMGKYTNHCNLLDLCAVAIPAGAAAELLPFGITLFALAEEEHLICGAAERFLDGGLENGALSGTAELESGRLPDVTLPENGAASRTALGTEQLGGDTVGVDGAIGVAAADGVTATVAAPAMTPVAVCGLHMRGLPLERQMLEHGARFLREAQTAPRYRLFKLATEPAKPGLVKQPEGGVSIALEVWEMPIERFGAFAALIPAPLGIGKVELEDGSEVPGFICEGYAASGGLGEAEDVSRFGGWRQMLAAMTKR
ncbi:hypothetical protein PA598K_06410 [Paenibacillus sp. 598K]|uniref:allophanate hydrolase n=1 Tax=Paenibacillus sp. 598K TaxID=1117987 RepID=UPI000FF9D2E2|nr:allophanate hydrolase [Paenibacillus sp. 598K]GBF77834.1 hypothetical protein PA598K_06410 [Paenibacillus sp. 598K]